MVKTQPMPVSHSGRVFTIEKALFHSQHRQKIFPETVLNIYLSQKGKFCHDAKTLP